MAKALSLFLKTRQDEKKIRQAIEKTENFSVFHNFFLKQGNRFSFRPAND
jgi:hypothetical protein